jgi:diguanylate cyclase (GGDEF)-like protein
MKPRRIPHRGARAADGSTALTTPRWQGTSWRAEAALWWGTPLRARVFTLLVVLCAATTSVAGTITAHITGLGLATLFALIAGGMANVELARLAEGGPVQRDRTHKGLSAWPFAASLLLPAAAVAWVVVPLYAHTRLRGLRIALWKWMLSAAILILSAQAAGRVFRALSGSRLPATGSAGSLGALAVAAGTVLAGEVLLFFTISRLNTASDEILLRAALSGTDFYLTEAAVLSSGAVAAVLCGNWPGYIVLAFPASVVMQRAVLFTPLKQEIRHDPKTGLLHWEAWRLVAAAALDRAERAGGAVTVALMDLDHFKAVNDTHGHLVGDEVLVGTADALAGLTRGADVVGRFGGDEFAVVLADTDREAAARVAARFRAALAELPLSVPGVRITASIGIAAYPPWPAHPNVDALIAEADDALYAAKRSGRDRIEG